MENLTLYIGIASLVGSVVSIILAVLAICFSLYFYTKGKNSEIEVSKALAGIKAQTQALQKIFGVQLDKLTDFATQPKQNEDDIKALLELVKNLPKHFADSFQPPGEKATSQTLLKETISAYIGIYYYVAVANYGSQGYLFEGQEDLTFNSYKTIVDQSYLDFEFMDKILSEVDLKLIKESPLNHLYENAKSLWKPHIKNSKMVLASQSGQQ